jgi:ribosomal protein S18 acetylase RimI-like enzyme
MIERPVQVQPVSPELLPDFLSFFDGEAFTDNPKWGFCYCQFSYFDHAMGDWKSRRLEENRHAACKGINGQTMRGYLAYRDGKPIGWCNAAPRHMLAAFDEPDPQAHRIGQITCFIVAQAHRGSGVAKALLQTACEGFRAQALDIVEATAFANAKTQAQNHYGPLSMFLAAGFVEHSRDDEGYITLRLELRQPQPQPAGGSAR